jgi:hypothetical protein
MPLTATPPKVEDEPEEVPVEVEAAEEADEEAVWKALPDLVEVGAEEAAEALVAVELLFEEAGASDAAPAAVVELEAEPPVLVSGRVGLRLGARHADDLPVLRVLPETARAWCRRWEA